MLKVMKRFIGTPPAEGARTAVYLALSHDAEGQTGVCYDNLRPVRTSFRSYDTELARRFWELAETVIGAG